MKYDYLIVGAGLTGAVIANRLTETGKKVLVVDKRNHIGGNCYTEKIEDIEVHKYGAHIFHTSDKEVWSFINRFAKFNSFINSPIARYKNEQYNLPFNMNTFYQLWGIHTPREAEEILQKKLIKKDNPKNLEEQALSLVGEDIYYKLIKEYTEKQWGRECKDLPPEIIKRLPLRFRYDNNYFNDVYQGIPVKGYTDIFNKLLIDSTIALGCDYLKNRNQLDKEAKMVIYTGKIDEYFGYTKGKLEYRSLDFKTKVLNEESFQGNAVVNYTSHEDERGNICKFTRIIEHKYFNYSYNSKTVITYEYPSEYKEGKEAYYPINDAKNNKLYDEYKKMADELNNVVFAGRLATYRYLDMDKIIKEALKVAKNIIKNA